MVFDLTFLNLELEAAATGEISKELLSHPAFKAIADHEKDLNRPVWDEESFRIRFASASTENPKESSDWGLAPLFHDRVKIQDMKNWLEIENEFLTEKIDEWIEKFTAVPQRPETRCVAYVGSYDAGFSPDVGNSTIYLNIPIFSCKEGFLETLVHESYHARMLSEKANLKCKDIEESADPIMYLLYFTFEEGIAEFIGHNGSMYTQYPVIPLRTPEEGSEELKQLLQRYKKDELSAQEVFDSFRQSDCCYTAGVYIANSVWEQFGSEGLELWSAKADLKKYYQAFLSTPQGADWPELEF